MSCKSQRTSWGLPCRQSGLLLFSIKMGWNMTMDGRASACPWKWTGKHCRKENTHRLDKCSDPWLVSCSLLWTPAPYWPILIHVQQTKYSLLSFDVPVISQGSVWWSVQKHRCETKVRFFFLLPLSICGLSALVPSVSLIPSHCCICCLLTTIRLNYTSDSLCTKKNPKQYVIEREPTVLTWPLPEKARERLYIINFPSSVPSMQ